MSERVTSSDDGALKIGLEGLVDFPDSDTSLETNSIKHSRKGKDGSTGHAQEDGEILLIVSGAGGMARVQALAAKPDDASSIPRTHMQGNN